MKRQLANYTFSASGKTVTLTDVPSGQVRLDRVLLIVNETRNAIMFNLADASVATATVSGQTITLSAVPVGSADTDKLAIFYDVPDAITKHVSFVETLSANTVPASGAGRTLTPTGFHATELEVTNIDGAAIVYGTLDGTQPNTTGNFLFCLPATPSNVVLPVDGAVTVRLISPGTPKIGYALRGS